MCLILFFKYSRSGNRYNKNVLFLEKKGGGGKVQAILKKLHLRIFVCLDVAVTLNLRKAVHIVPICIMIDYFRALYHWRIWFTRLSAAPGITYWWLFCTIWFRGNKGEHRGVDTCTMPWTMRGVGDFITHCFSFIIDLRLNETLVVIVWLGYKTIAYTRRR